MCLQDPKGGRVRKGRRKLGFKKEIDQTIEIIDQKIWRSST